MLVILEQIYVLKTVTISHVILEQKKVHIKVTISHVILDQKKVDIKVTISKVILEEKKVAIKVTISRKILAEKKGSHKSYNIARNIVPKNRSLKKSQENCGISWHAMMKLRCYARISCVQVEI